MPEENDMDKTANRRFQYKQTDHLSTEATFHTGQIYFAQI